MSFLSMFSGKGARMQMIWTAMEQQRQQAELMALEERNAAESKRQFEIEQGRIEEQATAERARNKNRALDASIARLGGFTGFRSLLSGRRGGGGFGPRSLLDAA